MTDTDNALPIVPNAETIEAMNAARRGELVTAESIDALFRQLNEEDPARLSS